MSRQLPLNPHIDVLKKQAKSLLADHQSGSAEALARVAAVEYQPSNGSGAFSLRDAQQVLAREYDFSSWQSLAERVRGDQQDWAVGRFDFFGKLAADLAAAHQAGDASSFGVLGERMRPAGAEEADALDAARASIASLSACDDWTELGAKAHEAIEQRTIDRVQLKELERIHEEFAARVPERFGGSADVAFVDYTTICEFDISIGRPSHSFRCSVDGLEGPFAVDVGPRLAASGDDGGEGAVRLLVNDLTHHLEPIVPAGNPSVQPVSDPFALDVARLYELCVLVAFEVEAEPGGLLSVCYPEPSITGLLAAIRG